MKCTITNSDLKQKAQRHKTVFYEAMNNDVIYPEMMVQYKYNISLAFHFLTRTGSFLAQMQHNEEQRSHISVKPSVKNKGLVSC